MGVELDRKRPGHSVAVFTDYQFTAQNDEYLNPARYQSRGFSVLLDAMWKGTRIAWCPYCYADNDAALMRGWIQGYPRKFGVVHQTRTFAAAESGFRAPRTGYARFPRPACRLMAGCWYKPRVTPTRKGGASCCLAYLIAFGLWDGDIFPRLASAGIASRQASREEG